ncbi:ABC transporter ATP-binding protein [Curvivirga aplysinae]|uniref:ABC transporter ATP-binding protein n=1 Tax=Curvivirga aplysinae TaxID=2529852 RepID=UPI0012BCD56F|nr:ATP-binding cassette domain-containing protein [Curvivirga aplysinae]MTI10363.1 ATP-binding cassette domain-containing protein [Curvivirga aplysinae]
MTELINNMGEKSLFASREISFAAGTREILKPLDLRLDTGLVYGLVGHNGSGKSTLLKILAKQLTATAGDILLNGRSLDNWSTKEFSRHVAYLPQDIPTVPNLTVRELVSHGRYPWHGAFRGVSDEDNSYIDDALTLTNITHMQDRMVNNLSGGERQRAWLAMLIAQNTSCLLLDEPISALDISHQMDVMGLIKDLSQQQNLSVVMVLHDINIAARFCDRIIALREGELIADHVSEDLMDPDLLKTIFNMNMKVIDHPSGKGRVALVD